MSLTDSYPTSAAGAAVAVETASLWLPGHSDSFSKSLSFAEIKMKSPQHVYSEQQYIDIL